MFQNRACVISPIACYTNYILKIFHIFHFLLILYFMFIYVYIYIYTLKNLYISLKIKLSTLKIIKK